MAVVFLRVSVQRIHKIIAIRAANITNGVLIEPSVELSAFICGAHTPPSLEMDTFKPTSVLLIGIG